MCFNLLVYASCKLLFFEIESSFCQDAAGVDSTFSTSTLFLLMMTLYPEVQRKAQEEIDRVVGQDRLPTLEEYA